MMVPRADQRNIKKMSVQCRDEKINRTFQLFIIHLKLYEMSPTVNNGLRHYIFCFLFCCSLSSYLGFGSPNPRKKKKRAEAAAQIYGRPRGTRTQILQRRSSHHVQFPSTSDPIERYGQKLRKFSGFCLSLMVI